MQDTLDALEGRLEALSRTGEETPEKVDVLIGIANALRSNNPQRTLLLAQEAYDLAVRLSYPHGQGHGLSFLAFAAYMKSDHETAYARFKEALAIFEALDDPWGKARVLHGMALVQMSLGDYEHSLTNGIEALKLFRQLGDVVEQVWTLIGFGTGYIDLGAYDRALQYFEEALALLDDGVDDVGKARALNGVGTVYHNMGAYEKALGYHQQSLAFFEAEDNSMGQARALDDLGIVYSHLGDDDRALDYHQRSLRIREDIGSRQSQSTSLVHLGNLYLQRGEVEPALDHLHRALAIAETIKVRARIYQAHGGLAKAYERQGRLAEALEHHKAYHRVHEEVMGEEARVRLNNVQIRFEVEKAEQAAEIERLRNVELKEKNDELRRVLEELKTMQAQLIQSEKLASLGQLTAGIAHEIKNPLNFVNNFSQLSRELTQDLEALLQAHRDGPVAEILEEVEALLGDLRFNADKIYEHGHRADGIVRNMLEHSRSTKGERQPTEVNALVEEYAGLAYHGMQAQDSTFNVMIARDYDAAAETVAMVPQEIGRVLLNLLNNAFYAVHEKADAGKEMRGEAEAGYTPTVTLSTRRRDDTVEIRVADNGPGIDRDRREKIFEPFFTTKPTGSGTGLGLSLSYDIVTQGHGGTLTVESEEGQGATFVITLPIDSRT
jgi:two-component system NtrC family sensor kinase